jgi:hypothetical protein
LNPQKAQEGQLRSNRHAVQNATAGGCGRRGHVARKWNSSSRLWCSLSSHQRRTMTNIFLLFAGGRMSVGGARGDGGDSPEEIQRAGDFSARNVVRKSPAARRSSTQTPGHQFSSINVSAILTLIWIVQYGMLDCFDSPSGHSLKALAVFSPPSLRRRAPEARGSGLRVVREPPQDVRPSHKNISRKAFVFV